MILRKAVSGYLTSLGRRGNFVDEFPQTNPPYCSVDWCCARRVTVSASSRCALGKSSGTLTACGANANPQLARKWNVKTECGNFSQDTKANAGSGRGANARCRRAGNSCCESRKENSSKKARDSRTATQRGRISRCKSDVHLSSKSFGS